MSHRAEGRTYELRDLHGASRAVAYLALAGAPYVFVTAYIDPTLNLATKLGVALVSILMAGTGTVCWRWPETVPRMFWFLAPIAATTVVAGLNFATHDASTGSQLFYLWPVLYAANFLSRRVIYQQFKDKDSLLLEAGLDFARRARQERRERIGDGPEMARARLVAMGAHFAEHRGLYRTMLTGSCAYAFGQALCELFASGNRQLIHRRYGDELDLALEQDLTDYLTGGTAAIVHSWVVSAPDPLDPEVLVDRLGRLLPLVLGPEPASGAS